MREPDHNEAGTPAGGGAVPPRGGHGCVQCGKVDSPIRIGPGPGWLALALWALATLLWIVAMIAEATWLTYPTAAVFLGALLYTLWYFYKREEACRHCGARWAGAGGSPSV